MFISIFEALQLGHRWNGFLFLTGTAVLLLGILIRLAALVQIGKGFSIKVERNDGQKIIRTGMHKHIRHPLHVASILQTLGSIAMLCSKFAWVVVPFAVYAAVARIKIEEKFLVEEFEDYAEYQKKTWKLVPWVY